MPSAGGILLSYIALQPQGYAASSLSQSRLSVRRVPVIDRSGPAIELFELRLRLAPFILIPFYLPSILFSFSLSLVTALPTAVTSPQLLPLDATIVKRWASLGAEA